VIFDLLASDYAILATLLLFLWLAVRRESSILRWMWNDQQRPARIASRIAFGGISAFLLWTTVFDNWRQMLGFLVSSKDRWRSDPYLYEAPPDAVRFVTFTLLAVAVLGGAYLYARYARGYLMPILLAPAGFVLFYVLNSFRMRFELQGPLSERGVDFSDPGEAIMTFIWFGMFYVVMAVLIFCAFALLWGPVSIVVSLIYRNTIGRQHIEEPEMYRILRQRSATVDQDRATSQS
jgi:hypothetical protein